MVLSCNPSALSILVTEIPNLNITWTHNGLKISKLKYHIDENFNLSDYHHLKDVVQTKKL